MNWKKITIIFVGIMTALIAGYDVFVILKAGNEASISNLLIKSAYEYPVIPFALGVVCGHLFWRMKNNKDLSKVLNEPETKV